MLDPTEPPATERQRLAQWIRSARLHPPRGMSAEWYDGFDAGLRRLMAETLGDPCDELRSFDALPPSRESMNRKPRAR